MIIGFCEQFSRGTESVEKAYKLNGVAMEVLMAKFKVGVTYGHC